MSCISFTGKFKEILYLSCDNETRRVTIEYTNERNEVCYLETLNEEILIDFGINFPEKTIIFYYGEQIKEEMGVMREVFKNFVIREEY